MIWSTIELNSLYISSFVCLSICIFCTAMWWFVSQLFICLVIQFVCHYIICQCIILYMYNLSSTAIQKIPSHLELDDPLIKQIFWLIHFLNWTKKCIELWHSFCNCLHKTSCFNLTCSYTEMQHYIVNYKSTLESSFLFVFSNLK